MGPGDVSFLQLEGGQKDNESISTNPTSVKWNLRSHLGLSRETSIHAIEIVLAVMVKSGETPVRLRRAAGSVFHTHFFPSQPMVDGLLSSAQLCRHLVALWKAFSLPCHVNSSLRGCPSASS